uniref:Uncharacterized protein n=1 Tax=Palpitomonas bilix TaxID=652834 RepID=A0A7S3GED7_9EUKA
MTKYEYDYTAVIVLIPAICAPSCRPSLRTECGGGCGSRQIPAKRWVSDMQGVRNEVDSQNASSGRHAERRRTSCICMPVHTAYAAHTFLSTALSIILDTVSVVTSSVCLVSSTMSTSFPIHSC